MAWSDVVGKINFAGPLDPVTLFAGSVALGEAFSDPDETAILNAMEDLYEHSPTAQAMIDQAIQQYGIIEIFQATPQVAAQAMTHYPKPAIAAEGFTWVSSPPRCGNIC